MGASLRSSSGTRLGRAERTGLRRRGNLGLSDAEWFLLTVSVLASVGSLFAPQSATWLQIGLSAIVVWVGGRATLPVLAILWFQREGVGAVGAKVDLSAAPGGALTPGASAITVQIAVLAFTAARVLQEMFFAPRTLLRRRQDVVLLGTWLLLVAISAASALWGRAEGQSNWTQPLRMSLSLSGFFYAGILSKKGGLSEDALRGLSAVVTSYVVALAAGAYWHHVLFLFAPACAAVAALALRHRGVLVAAAVGSISLLAASRVDTFTMYGAVVLSALVGMSVNRDEGKGARLSKRILACAGLVSLLLPIWALTRGNDPDRPMARKDVGILERLEGKVFSDRVPIWKGALESIKEQEGFIVPAGRPLFYRAPGTESDREWGVHCHNSFLEAFRSGGVAIGTLFGGLVLGMWLSGLNGLGVVRGSRARAFVIAGMSTAVVGACTGLFPFDMNAGVWVWVLIGAGATAGARSHASIKVETARGRVITSSSVGSRDGVVGDKRPRSDVQGRPSLSMAKLMRDSTRLNP